MSLMGAVTACFVCNCLVENDVIFEHVYYTEANIGQACETVLCDQWKGARGGRSFDSCRIMKVQTKSAGPRKSGSPSISCLFALALALGNVAYVIQLKFQRPLCLHHFHDI